MSFVEFKDFIENSNIHIWTSKIPAGSISAQNKEELSECAQVQI